MTRAAAPARADEMKLLFLCLKGVPEGELLVEAETIACFEPRRRDDGFELEVFEVLARSAWYRGEADRDPARQFAEGWCYVKVYVSIIQETCFDRVQNNKEWARYAISG